MILDTFEILFSTNAKKSRDDVASLDKELDGLEKKGKKRSDEENKQYQELSKRRKELLDQIKQQQRETDKLGDSFQSMATNAIGAVTAFATFQGLKNTLIDVNKLNASLAVAHDAWGVNVQDLKAVGAAIDKTGQSGQAFIQWYLQFAAENKVKGLPTPQPSELINRAAEAYKNYQGQRQLAANGLLPLAIEILGASPEKRDQLLKQGLQTVGPFGSKEQAAALANEGASATTKQVERARATEILTEFSGAVEDFNKSVQLFLGAFSGHPVAAAAASGVAILGGGAVLSSVAKQILGLGIAAGAATSALLRIGLLAVPAAIAYEDYQGAKDVVTGSRNSALGKASQSFADKILDFLQPNYEPKLQEMRSRIQRELKENSQKNSANKDPLGIRSNNPGNLMPGGHEAVYGTPQQGISALAAQLRRYGSRGWDTVDSIISHYAPPGTNNTSAYISDVLKDTGFKSGQHLNLNDPVVLQRLIPAIIKHENGYNPYSTTLIQSAIASQNTFASTSSGSSIGKSVNVKIDEVKINTQATDAQGIANTVASELKNQIRLAMNNLDDGVNY